ncbi:hypothetical protein JCM16303_001617 [Sporobolomyces ruberrimus]
MLPFARPAVFNLTLSTPSPLTYDEGITPKHTLNVHDLDGSNREWTVQASISKISIYNSKNLTLRLPGRIITSTIDIWKSSNLRIIIDSPSVLGTLQLDPTLEDVKIQYVDPESIGKIVLAPLKDKEGNSFGFKNLSFQAGRGGREYVLADHEGNLFDPRDREVLIKAGDPDAGVEGQWVLSFEEGDGEGWRVEGLRRGAMDYPIL